MSAGPDPAPRARFRLLRLLATDITPLRAHPGYRALWLGNVISSTGRQITVVALAYQVYTLTQSSLAVGAIGAAQVVPLMAMSLFGGSIADSVDRRRLLVVVNLLMAGCSIALCGAAFAGLRSLPLLYVLAALIAGGAATDNPTRTAVVPRLVPPELLTSAMSLNTVAVQITLVAGPALAGVIIAASGPGFAYLADVVSFIGAVGAAFAIGPQPPAGTPAESRVRAVAEGFAWVSRNRVLRTVYLVDVVAAVFGLRRALFPYLATTAFAVGATGLGLLYAAPAAGALLASSTSGWVARSRLGLVVMIAAALYGLAAVGMGAAGTFTLVVVAAALGGAADAYSVVSRSTLSQTLTPDRMRGRVSGIQFMAANAGNYGGDLEAGTAAAMVSPRFSIISGGVVVVAAAVLAMVRAPELTRYRTGALAEPAADVSTPA